MSESERLTDLARSYVLGHASDEELRELSRLIDESEASKERVAQALADAGLIAGWFAAESDGLFVAEALAAIKASGTGQPFVENTLDRIRRSPRSKKILRGRSRSRKRSSLFPLALAASLLLAAAVGAILFLNETSPGSGILPESTSRKDSERIPEISPIPEKDEPVRVATPDSRPVESPPSIPGKPIRNAVAKKPRPAPPSREIID